MWGESELRVATMSAKQKPSETRKVRKPLMEKRRRARINDSLDELKKMLALEASPGVEQSTRPSKLEKADILELTVRHFQRLQRRAATGSSLVDDVACPERKFAAGFRACAQTTREILGEYTGLDAEVKRRLTAHLSSCLESLHTTPKATPKPTPARKLSVVVKTESRTAVDRFTLPDSTQNIGDCSNEAVSANQAVNANEAVKVFPIKLANGGIAYVVPGGCDLPREETKEGEEGVWRPW